MSDDIYYSPDRYNCKVIGDVDIAGGWEFDIFLVIEDIDRNLMWATDSGCSCPTPFDRYDTGDFTIITKDSFPEFESSLFSHKPYNYNSSLKEQVLWYPASLDLFTAVSKLYNDRNEAL